MSRLITMNLVVWFLFQLFSCIVADTTPTCSLSDNLCGHGSYSFVRKVTCSWETSAMNGEYALKISRRGESGNKNFLKEREITKELGNMENIIVPKGDYKCKEVNKEVFEKKCLFSKKVDITAGEYIELNKENDLYEVTYIGDDKSICLLSTLASEGNFFEFLKKTMDVYEDPVNTVNYLVGVNFIKWMTQMANALKVLESYNIIHRDIKPSNLLISKVGEAISGIPQYNMYLSDFGLAIKKNEIQTFYDVWTSSNQTYFTPPEISVIYSVDYEEYYTYEIDSKANIYQLGLSFIVIFFPTTYRYPELEKEKMTTLTEIQKFYSTHINAVRDLMKAREGFFTKIFGNTRVNRDILNVIKELLYKMTEENPYDRPSVHMVLEKLDEVNQMIKIRIDDTV
eukprot:GHVR01191580.1.p1 GENE.GHVR01191580.1~~GHVR01191580.1.p1  ORF type:complete len:398 (+),score=39.59 GHVR01191580.1:34-1227(+)